MVTDFEKALATLTGAGVEFIVIGGAAGTLHGSAFITQDLDVVYARNRDRCSAGAALGVHALACARGPNTLTGGHQTERHAQLEINRKNCCGAVTGLLYGLAP
jgi:hypothetical protein